MKKVILTTALVAAFVCCLPMCAGRTALAAEQGANGTLVPVRPRCEYLANPLGIDTRRPRLSWALKSNQPGQKQTAYRILVASTEEQLAKDKADLWDSGKVESSETAHVPYAGASLKSGQRCFWKVMVWQKDATPAGTSAIAWWEMGLLDPSDWKGKWIAGPEPCPYFRKVFTASRPVRGVRLYICGQGVYEARINGKALGDQVLGPQLSYYPKRMLYDTFDVASLMKQGKNVVAVWLAPGWFGGDRRARQVIKKPDGPGHALIAQLIVRYADGTEDIIATDQSWKTKLSPFQPVKSHWVHCYQGSGEHFDAEKAPFGWDTPRFDDTAWANARETKAPTKRLCARMIEPNRIVPELNWVKAEYDSIRGTIASHWTFDKGHFTLTVTIPPNTTALLYVPATDPSGVKAPGGPLAKFQRMEGACALYEIASGTHRFESDLPKPISPPWGSEKN